MLSLRTSLLPMIAILIAAAVGWAASPYMGAATLAYACLIGGMIARSRSRTAHRMLMGFGISLDLALVLLLEFRRDAIGTVLSLNMTTPQLAHVLFSLLAVLLYIPLVFLGRSLWARESKAVRRWHRRLGRLAFLFRSLGFVLMFSLLSRSSS
jgi:hypothetical protein